MLIWCEMIFFISGKLPTVLSPELYRSRFLEAMDKYFLMVPDRWHGLADMDSAALR